METNRVKKQLRQRVVEPVRQLNIDVEDVSFNPSEGELRGLVTVDSDASERTLELLFERESGNTELTLTYKREEETVEFEAELEREDHSTQDTQQQDDTQTSLDTDTQ